MSGGTLGNDNKLFRRGIRRDFIKIILQDLKQAQKSEIGDRALMKTKQIQTEVEKMSDFLTAMDDWENDLLGCFLKIKRYISRGLQNGEDGMEIIQTEEILDQIEKLKGGVPAMGIKQVKMSSDEPPKSTTNEVPESSNSGNQKDDCRAVTFEEFTEFMRNLNPEQRDCLHSIAIFPENTTLKKRLVIHWWIGLGRVLLREGCTMEQSGEIVFYSLLEKCILKPARVRQHNHTVECCIIDPILHMHLKEFGKDTWHFYGDVEANVEAEAVQVDVQAVINMGQKQLNSKSISKITATKVAQFGRWSCADLEVPCDINETTHNVTQQNEHIEVDGTKFLKNLRETVTYLSLNGVSRIEELPESVAMLKNLMILDLRDCHNLQKLPQKPKQTNQWFKKLTHLDLTGCYLLDHMPKWVSELSNLQKLKGAVFNGYKTEQCQLQDLSKLKKLTKLGIKIMHYRSLAPGYLAALELLDNLLILTIVWGIDETVETEKESRENTQDSSISFVSTGGEQQTGVYEDQIFTTEKQSRENARTNWHLFRFREKNAGTNKTLMALEKQSRENLQYKWKFTKGKKTTREDKDSWKEPTIIFPKNLQKLDIRCYPNAKAPGMLRAAGLPELKRLYIRGGKLTKITDDVGWNVEILRLRHLKKLRLSWYEVNCVFPKLQYVEYAACTKLYDFPKGRNRWMVMLDGPFPSRYGPFNYDEPIFIVPSNSVAAKPIVPGRVQLTIGNYPTVSTAKTRFRFMVKLEYGFSVNDISESRLDLVMILDTTRSMEGNKLKTMKAALPLIFKKLGAFDRLSIVTFGTMAKIQCGLCKVSESFQMDVQDLVNNLEADGYSNICDGLQIGFNVLKDRMLSIGRTCSIMLISGGVQTSRFGDVVLNPIDNVAVHTFGLGDDYDAEVLKSIASNSIGGTFSDVQNMNNLSSFLSNCLDMIIPVVAQDLTLTLTPLEGSTIEQVSGRDYQQSKGIDDGAVTVKLGNINRGNVREVLVELLLPAVPKQKGADIIEICYTYVFEDLLYESSPAYLNVRRSNKVNPTHEARLPDDRTYLKADHAELVFTPEVPKDAQKQQLGDRFQSGHRIKAEKLWKCLCI